MNRYRIAAAVLASTSLLVGSPAFALTTQSDEGTIAVSLTVVDDCVLETNPLNLGSTGVVDANVDSSTTIIIECTKDSPYQIALDEGANATGDDVDTRHVTNGVETLLYQLYSGSAGGTVWGHTVGVNTVGAETASGGDETYTIYSRVAAHQNAPAGSYTDTVTATIWYGVDLATALAELEN